MGVNIKQEQNGGMSLIRPGGVRVKNFGPAPNKDISYIVGQVARTDTVAKTIGVIPAGGVPISLSYGGVANSDAAGTAVISAGYTTGTEFLNGVNVKANSVNQTFPAAGAALHAALSATVDTTITAIYAETSTASTTGGPWTIVIGYFMPV